MTFSVCLRLTWSLSQTVKLLLCGKAPVRPALLQENVPFWRSERIFYLWGFSLIGKGSSWRTLQFAIELIKANQPNPAPSFPSPHPKTALGLWWDQQCSQTMPWRLTKSISHWEGGATPAFQKQSFFNLLIASSPCCQSSFSLLQNAFEQTVEGEGFCLQSCSSWVF